MVLLFFLSSITLVTSQDWQDLLPCSDGDTQSCGSNIGVCQSGYRNCFNARWAACDSQEYPETEICGNNLDDNCDGRIDESLDNDGDGYSVCGYGKSGKPKVLRRPLPLIDCNDNNRLVNPGAPEVCNGMDDNCDGEVDKIRESSLREYCPRCIAGKCTAPNNEGYKEKYS